MKRKFHSLKPVVMGICLMLLLIGKHGGSLYGQGADFSWVKTFGSTNNDKGTDIATDALGNVYVIGQFRRTIDFDPGAGVVELTSSSSSSYDIFVAKYDTAGGLLWVKQVGVTLNENVADNAIALDATGSVFITGGFTGTLAIPLQSGVAVMTSAGGLDVFVAKLNGTTGAFQWAKGFGGTAADAGNDIVTDASGNVYTTGYFRGIEVDFDPGTSTVFTLSALGTSTDIFIQKLDPSGNFVWAKSVGNTQADNGYAITTDASGNVYTTGVFQGNVDFDPGAGTYILNSTGSIFIQKLNSEGNFVWAKCVGGNAGAPQAGYGITTDGQGNVLVMGYFDATSGDFDPGVETTTLYSANGRIFILKLNAAGGLIWVKQMGGSAATNGGGRSIKTDAFNSVYTTGILYDTGDFNPGAGTYTLTSAGNNDAFISKLDVNGDFVWAKRFGGSSGSDFGQGIALGPNWEVYTTGQFRAGPVDFDPGTGVFNVTAVSSTTDLFIHKMMQPVCSGAPNAGTAVASLAVACSNMPVTLSLSGNATDMLITYEWESSPTETPFNPTSLGAPGNSPNLIINPTATKWYRAKVSCNGGAPVYAVPIQLSVDPGFFGNYTINQSLPTGGTNFNSFTSAVNALTTACAVTGPVVFDVQPGTYNEQITIPQLPGVSASNTVTFNGNGATLAFNGTGASPAGIILNGADRITIKNLIIDGTAGPYSRAIVLFNKADYNKISNCIIHMGTASTTGLQQVGISAFNFNDANSQNNTNFTTIENNTITGGECGIRFYGFNPFSNSDSSVNSYNVIKNNIITDAQSHLIWSFWQNNVTISNNDLSRPATPFATGDGMYLGGGTAGGNTIEKNRIHSLFASSPTYAGTASAIHLEDYLYQVPLANPSTIKNNLIYDIKNEGTVYGIYGTGWSRYNNIIHNTILLDGSGNGPARGMFFEGNYQSYINFENNIVSITKGGSGAKYGIYVEGTNTGCTSNHNVINLNSSGSGAVNVGHASGTDYATLAAWQTGTTYDANSVAANPQFANITQANFYPQNTSVYNIGAPLGLQDDIYGNARNMTNPFPGASETAVPLSVTASLLTGKLVHDAYAQLEWKTFKEQNNAGFEIQRSGNGRDFYKAGALSSIAEDGNSDNVLHYQFIDKEVINGKAYYRYRQSDLSGNIYYSNIISISAAGQQSLGIKAYPNPVTHFVTIISGKDLEHANVRLSNMMGQHIHTISGLNGNTINLDMTAFMSGIYILEVADGINTERIKLIKE